MMVRRTDIRDWYVMLHMGAVLIASTIFVFLHPEQFVHWAEFVGVVGAVFHWLCIHDDKVPDVSNPGNSK